MELAVTVIAIGAIVFLAHLFSILFERTKVPDVLPLVTIGLILGPILGLATQEHLGEVGPVFSNLTLVLILFESGLNMKLTALKDAVRPASILGILGYIASTLVVMFVSIHVYGLEPMTALVLGAILGGTAASVAVPLTKDLSMTKRSRMSLMLESVLGNVLTIVVSLALLTAIEQDKLKPFMVLGSIISTFTMGSIIGGCLGYAWCTLLAKVRTLDNTKFTTPAFVCIAFGLAKLFGFSGMMAALAFGIVMGNARKLPPISPNTISDLRPRSINAEERALFSELVFLMKTFFFVYLGMSIRWIGTEMLLTGLVITACLLAVRPLVVSLSFNPRESTRFDATIASIMMPRGLASAVLASIAVEKQIADAVVLQNCAYTVILLSIALVAIFTFFCERGWLNAPASILLFRFPVDEEGGQSSQPEKGESNSAHEALIEFVQVNTSGEKRPKNG